jgi:hypothetical protein
MGQETGFRISEYKAKKGLIRVKIKVDKDRIKDIEITGDFIIHPEEALWSIQEKLRNCSLSIKDVREKVLEAIRESNAILVGFEAEDVVQAVMEALSNG